MEKILFVCSGNTCRSPMAAAFCQKYLLVNRLNDRYYAESAGVSAFPGDEATPETIEVMAEAGFDLREHRARRLTAPMVEEAVWIYALSKGHQELLIEAFPHKKNSIRVLGSGIEDPYGQGLLVYRDCRDVIDGQVGTLVTRLRQNMDGVGY